MIVALQRFTAHTVVASTLCFACSSQPQDDIPRSNGGSAGATVLPSAGSSGSAGAASSAGTSSGGAGGAAQAGGNAGGSAGASGGSAGAALGGAGGGGSGAGGGAGTGGSAGSGGIVPLEPCTAPSVSHLKVWEMQVVSGTQVPANGSPLRAYAGGHELYVEWTLQGGGYGTANAPLKNKGQYSNGIDPAQYGVDISQGPALSIEYSSTGNTYLQIRTGAVPHGGDHFRADLPSTDGQIKTIALPLDGFRRPGGNTPPGADVLKDAFSFTFVGGGSTKLTLRQVLIPGFVPPCD